jgi:hypothetical protein
MGNANKELLSCGCDNSCVCDCSGFNQRGIERVGYFERHPVVFGALLMAVFVMVVLGSLVYFRE